MIAKSPLGKFYQRRMDIFYFFFHLALNLGKSNSQIVLITTNYYPTADGAKKLRQDFKDRAIVRELINFNELKIFESAQGQHNMITALTKANDENGLANTCITKRTGFAKPEVLQKLLNRQDEHTNYYSVRQKELYESDEYYIRLSGNDFSSNSLQSILTKIKNQGVLLGSISNLDQGIVSGADKVTDVIIRDYSNLKLKKGDGIFILTKEELSTLRLTKRETRYIKPTYKNSDIKKWHFKPSSKFFVIYLKDEGETIRLGINLKRHFKKYKAILVDKKRNCFKNKWLRNIVEPWLERGNYFVLFYPRSEEVFEDIKIVNSRRSKRNIFALEDQKMYEQSDIVITTLKSDFKRDWEIKYILSLLNSKLYFVWFYHKGKRKGETLELFQKPLSQVPIKSIPLQLQSPFVTLVDKIFSITKSDGYVNNQAKQAKVKEYEREIDQLVYKLYGLTSEEIEIVEGDCVYCP